jgi:hypothetical protein
MKTNMKVIILIIVLAFGSSLQTQAQFLNIRINIPAGMVFSEDPRESVFGGMAGNADQGPVPITWIAMESMENLSFLVSIENQNPDKEMSPNGFYINQSGWDMSAARELFPGPNQLTIDNRNLLIRNISPKVSFLHAWLGVPSNRSLTIKIEYP